MHEKPETPYVQRKLKRLFRHEHLWKIVPFFILATFLIFRYYGTCTLRSFAENNYGIVQKVTYVEFTPYGETMQTMYETATPAEINELMNYFARFFVRPTFFGSGSKGGGTWWAVLEFEGGTRVRIAIDQSVAVEQEDNHRAYRYILRRPSVEKISQLAYSAKDSQCTD